MALHGPPEIAMELHALNRAKLVHSFRQYLKASSRPLFGFVLLQGGQEQTRYCSDHVMLFRQESYFAYLFGVREPGFYGAIDVSSGKSILFAPRLSEEYAIWSGKIKPLSSFKERYVNDTSAAAHIEVMQKTEVGLKEYQLEMVFLHHIYMHGGCRHCSYTCICATGENSAIIHYGHAAAPNDRTLEDGDMALMDMGAEYHFYASDISCSFPVNGKFNDGQRLVYNAVLQAHNVVLSEIKPGVCWIDMHKLAERHILESLVKGGVLVGDVDGMMDARLGATFMPHGLGHFLGIDAHDPGDYPQGTERPNEPGLKALRTTRELKEGMVITVSPRCYFNDVFLKQAMENPNTSKFINSAVITRFMQFGGVRIESDVHVISNGCENFTDLPRETWEIEAVMAGESWPLVDETILKYKKEDTSSPSEETLLQNGSSYPTGANIRRNYVDT